MRLTKIIAVLFAVGVTFLPTAVDAQPAPVPTATQLCGYIGYNNVHHVAGYQVLFARYEVLNTTYAEARCLVAWPVSGGYLYAGFNARVYSNGSWAGPYNLVWA